MIQHETCVEYFQRRLDEGWKCIEYNYPKTVLLSPEGIRREIDLRNDVETLRPDSAGDECSIESQVGNDCPHHYLNVNEVSADDDTLYVRNETNVYQRDLYNLPASSGTGTINFIKIYFRCEGLGTKVDTYFKPSLVSNSTITDGTEVEPANSNEWVTYSQQWNTNPANGAWEWADIDALQIGVSLKGRAGAGSFACCTQVYVEIDYTPAIAPTVTTQAATDVEATTATGNGNITNTGYENPHTRGICYMEGSSGDPTTANDKEEDNGIGSYGTGAFPKGLTGLTPATDHRARAYAINSAGTGYGVTVGFTTAVAGWTGKIGGVTNPAKVGGVAKADIKKIGGVQ